jgi:hypothetical protein
MSSQTWQAQQLRCERQADLIDLGAVIIRERLVDATFLAHCSSTSRRCSNRLPTRYVSLNPCGGAAALALEIYKILRRAWSMFSM